MKIFSVITFCLLVCVTFSHADLMEGLVLYMPLDEGSGSATQDFSANGLEGEVMGNAKWVDGQFGKALQFAAAADHVVVEDDAAFHIEGCDHTSRHGYNWTGCRVHTLLFAVPGRVVRRDTSVSGSG